MTRLSGAAAPGAAAAVPGAAADLADVLARAAALFAGPAAAAVAVVAPWARVRARGVLAFRSAALNGPDLDGPWESVDYGRARNSRCGANRTCVHRRSRCNHGMGAMLEQLGRNNGAARQCCGTEAGRDCLCGDGIAPAGDEPSQRLEPRGASQARMNVAQAQAKSLPRATEQGTDRSVTERKVLGELVVREATDLAQQERIALRAWQISERLP